MRLVFAVVSFVLAAVLITGGIVQRTVFAPADSVDLSVTTGNQAPVTVIDSSTLAAHEGRQTLIISGEGEINAAYGRTVDVLAWVGNAAYNTIGYDAETDSLVTTLTSGSEATVPELDSDLWWESYQAENRFRLAVTIPDGVSLIITSDGGLQAPRNVTISWPLDASTPWSGPMIVAGAAFLVLGLILLLVTIHGINSGGGPKRKLPKVPKAKTIKAVRSSNRTPSSAPLGASLVAALLLVGVVSLPASAADETSEPAPATGQPIPAVTTVQTTRIVERVLATIQQADSTLDADLAATRLAGPALELRSTDYTLQAKDAKVAAYAPRIPSDAVIALSLPQQVPADIAAWPRTIMVVVADPRSLGGTSTPTSEPTDTPTSTGTTAPSSTATPEATDEATGTPEAEEVLPPVVLFLTQDSPRDPYRATYLMTLQSNTPDVAAATVGAAVLSPTSPLFSVTPDIVTQRYADVLTDDTESLSYESFDLSGDNLSLAWGVVGQQELIDAQAKLSSPNKVAFETTAGDGPLIVLATTDSGALVTGTVEQVVSITPGEKGAKVIASDSKSSANRVRLLTGKERSATGYDITYAGQVLFFVPALDADAPITVIGYSQGLVSAAERK